MPDQNQTDPNSAAPVNYPGQTVVAPPSQDVTQTDVPPMPSPFSMPDTSAPITATTEDAPVATTPAEEDSGSAAPPDLPPMTTGGPKKKFGTGKIIATILGIFLLVGGIAGGVLLTQQNQNIGEKADACSSLGSPAARQACRANLSTESTNNTGLGATGTAGSADGNA